ncbi:GrpB family protein [Pleurocapsa sp. FMAR1]|uniref:GrpB family protein n=1 Tax=Pleurocapsa sp. FMAR1 TaxID=3040204 RepID=UPI0029C7993C|nr:GrpB family protein [Pleurocapsa sp. FMAR1]
MFVEVVPYNPQWKKAFNAESEKLIAALAENLVFIHHIGSTAIPNIHAKPIIDFLIEVKNIDLITEQTSAIEKLGYEAMGEFGLSGRRYFRKENPSGIRTHHVHIYETNSPEIKRHLAFRDYMIAHPENAEQYSQLKQELAQKHPYNIEGYMDGKNEFVKRMEKKAMRSQTFMNQSDRL